MSLLTVVKLITLTIALMLSFRVMSLLTVVKRFIFNMHFQIDLLGLFENARVALDGVNKGTR